MKRYNITLEYDQHIQTLAYINRLLNETNQSLIELNAQKENAEFNFHAICEAV